jgi:hypothetical protein
MGSAVKVEVMAIRGAAAVSGIISSSSMADFADLLRENRNDRGAWRGQAVSEIGGYIHNIAVFGLGMQTSEPDLVSGASLVRRVGRR